MSAFLQSIAQLGQALGTAKLRQTALSQQAAQQAFQEKIAQRTIELRQLGIEQTAAFRQAQEEARMAAERSTAEYRRLSLALRGAKPLVVADPASPTKWSYQLFVPGQGLVGGKTPGAPPPASAAPKGVKSEWAVDAKSSTGFALVNVDQNGNILSRTPNILPPSGYLQKSRVSYKVMTNADGSQSLVPVTSPGGPVIPRGNPPSSSASHPGGVRSQPSAQMTAAGNGLIGRPIPFGHKPLPATTMRAIGAGVESRNILLRLQPMIQSLASNPETANTALDKLTSSQAALLYQLGISPGFVRSSIANLHGVLTLVLQQELSQGRINQRTYDALEAHTPAPSDTPALMLDKLRNALQVTNEFLVIEAKMNGIKIAPGGEISQPSAASPAGPPAAAKPVASDMTPAAAARFAKFLRGKYGSKKR